jgi:peptidoglycan/LPS O-acetylase OafA/YrhL
VPAYGRTEVRQSWHFAMTFKGALQQMALFNLRVPDNVPYLLPQDWSLGVEMKASLLIPIFVFLAKGKRVISLLVVGALLMVISSHGYYISFLLGVALARGFDQIIGPVSTWSRRRLWLLFVFGILLYQSRHIAIDLLQLPESASGYFWCVNSLGCVMILIAALSHGGMQKVLQHKFFVFLGRISYSIYLFHMLVLICAQPLIVYCLNQMGITTALILLPVSLGLNILLTLLLANWSYRFVEVPSINLGHSLTVWVQNRFCRK